MVISQPPGIILHIIIVLHQRCLNCSECFQRHLMFYTCNYNIRVTHRNGAIKHIFYTNQIHGGIISRLFFIHFVSPCAGFIQRLKYYQLFCMKIWARWPYIHLSVVFPSRMPAGPHLLRNQYIWNIPNIWHKSSTKNTRRSDQIETIKTIMQTTRPRITWKVLPMAQVAISFKEIFDQVRKI